MWKNVGKILGQAFLSGSVVAKLDDKNRFVLPQSMRYHLVENGALEFSVGLGLGGCLTIYRKSAIEKIAEKFKEKQHVAKYQKFLTLFFSTLHSTGCDKLGRISLPSLLKSSVKIQKEIVVVGVIDKIELWPKELYDQMMEKALSGHDEEVDFQKMSEDAFSLLQEVEEPKPMQKISESLIPSVNEPVRQ